MRLLEVLPLHVDVITPQVQFLERCRIGNVERIERIPAQVQGLQLFQLIECERVDRFDLVVVEVQNLQFGEMGEGALMQDADSVV